MRKIEKMLNNKKLEMDEIKVSEEIEGRLRVTLDNAPSKNRKNYKLSIKIAALIVAILLVGYNMDTFAYYGKRLLGFDEVMTDTLKNSNEIGKGQIIDKSYTFNNGVNVTLNGIMMDDNQFLAFYTIKSPKGYVDKIHLQTSYLEGLVGKHHMESGSGNTNESKT